MRVDYDDGVTGVGGDDEGVAGVCDDDEGVTGLIAMWSEWMKHPRDWKTG